MKFLWLAVTPDIYELPLCVEESASLLAKRLGVTPGTIMSSARTGRSGVKAGRKIIKIEI